MFCFREELAISERCGLWFFAKILLFLNKWYSVFVNRCSVLGTFCLQMYIFLMAFPFKIGEKKPCVRAKVEKLC